MPHQHSGDHSMAPVRNDYSLSQLDSLEAESIHIIREVAAEFERPVRVFSFRDEFGQWDPKNQRPELWGIYNTRIRRGEHIRVFPLSNWTELDVWEYIDRENLEIPSIYYAHTRSVFERDGILLADSAYVTRGDDETVFETKVRYRTV